MKLIYNIIDEKFYIKNEDGFTCGIGETVKEAVENAEFWGFNCENLEEEEI